MKKKIMNTAVITYAYRHRTSEEIPTQPHTDTHSPCCNHKITLTYEEIPTYCIYYHHNTDETHRNKCFEGITISGKKKFC